MSSPKSVRPVSGGGRRSQEVEESQEEARVRVRKEEAVPNETEVEEHNIDHAVFRSWCPHCVKGRATGKQHNKRVEETEILVFGYQ